MFINTSHICNPPSEGDNAAEGISVARVAEAKKGPEDRIRKMGEDIGKDIKGLIESTNDDVLDLLNDSRRRIIADLAEADGFQAWHLENLKKEVERNILQFTKKARGAMDDVIEDLWDKGMKIIALPLVEEGILASPIILSRSLLEQMAAYRNDRIINLGRSAMDKIHSEILMGVMGEKSVSDVIKNIGKNLKDKSVFSSLAARAEAIAMTESGRIFNAASFESLKKSAELIPGLEKEWRHSGKRRYPRRPHRRIHGQHIPVNQAFRIVDLRHGGVVKMMHPHDPKAPAGQVIKCGCQLRAYHADWEKAAKVA